MAQDNARRPYGLNLPKKAKSWVYDFQYPPGGPRYSKSTRCSVYRDALRVAAKAFNDAEEAYKRHQKTPDAKPEILIREAFGRFYAEKGVHYAKPKDILSALKRVAMALGPDRFLSDVTTSLLLEYRTIRAREVSPRTVNADVVDLLRAVFKHARLWKVELGELGDRNFEWGNLKLEAAAHRTRVLTPDEQDRLFAHMREDYRPIIRFALLTGLRFSAWFLKREQIDWDNNLIVYRKKSKRTNDMGVVPMSKAVRALIKEEIEKGGDECEWVFTFKCEQKRGEREAGKRYPLTREGVKSYMQRLQAKAGVDLTDVRLHDLRHTAATEILRSGASIVVVQQLLGHSDVSQTSRYTNLITKDVEAALEARDLGGRRSHEFSHENANSMKGA